MKIHHSGDCSIYKACPETGNVSVICDCGALRKAYVQNPNHIPVIDMWMRHETAINFTLKTPPPSMPP